MTEVLTADSELYLGDVLEVDFTDNSSWFAKTEDDFLDEVLDNYPFSKSWPSPAGPVFANLVNTRTYTDDKGNNHAVLTVLMLDKAQPERGGSPVDPGQREQNASIGHVVALGITLGAVLVAYFVRDISMNTERIYNGRPGDPPPRVQAGEALTIASIVVGVLGILYFTRKATP